MTIHPPAVYWSVYRLLSNLASECALVPMMAKVSISRELEAVIY